MTRAGPGRSLYRIAAAVLGFALAVAAAPAAPNDIPDPAVTLLSGGGLRPDGTYRAGLEIAMGPGWKTYWRQPGDSGIPPTFDFSGSGNLASVTIAYPAPVRERDPGGESLVYHDEVLFPLTVTPADPSQPVRLLAEVRFGYCREICIPALKDTWVLFTPDAGPDVGATVAIAAAEAAVPVPEAAGLLPRLAGLEAEADGSFLIEVEAESAEAPVDVFAEGPTEDWRLPLPQLVSREGTHAVFRLRIGGVPDGATAVGAAVRFTMVGQHLATEAVRTLP